MDDVLLAEVYEHLDRADLDGDTTELVMAACEDQLDDMLDGVDVVQRALDPAALADPIGAYLTSITVEGFRGIGSQRKLKLSPGPGLTVVVGRNGSGKSSFAEAVEVVLTGSSSRWLTAKTKVWQEGWRNVHAGTPRLQVEVTEEGATSATLLTREWDDPDVLDAATTTVRRAGGGPEPMDVLGWQEALTKHRPILSYHELGSMLQGEPSTLHDALAGILGVGDLAAAITRLAEARKAAELPAKDVKTGRAVVLDRLRQSADERAHAVLTSLEAKTADLDQAELLLLVEEDAADGLISTLRRVTTLRAPSAADVADACDELVRAREAAAAVEGTDAGRARQTAALLSQALDAHREGESQPCPVCQTGTLDDEWREQTRAEIERLQTAAQQAVTAAGNLQRSQAAITELQRPLPDLGPAAEAGLDVAAVEAASAAWSAVPDDPGGIVDHLLATQPPLVAAVEGLVARAEAQLESHQSEWSPIARETLAWISQAREATLATARAKRLTRAEKWLKECQTQIKDARFSPVRDQTRALWSQLRLASNVELRDIGLEGTATRRRVVLDVSVDGADANALGVMSQGELHALALAIFIPRATRPESPFRFLLVDDPVQSMDPSRVDGLARVLADVSTTRQVVVFTHDDRLTEALRRLRLGGRVVGVTRQPGSIVTVREESDPVSRAIGDAKTLARSEELSPAIRSNLVPGFLRVAIEAACTERFKREQLGRGMSHHDVETMLLDADRVRDHLSLALEGEPGKDVGSRLRAWDKRFPDIVRWVNDGAHGKAPVRTGDELWDDLHVGINLLRKLGASL